MDPKVQRLVDHFEIREVIERAFCPPPIPPK